MTTPPPGDEPEGRLEGEAAEEQTPPTPPAPETPERPPWAWEPDLDDDLEPAAEPIAPPPAAPESGLEMLERLRERGLISEEEFAERAGQFAAATPEPGAAEPAPFDAAPPPPPPPLGPPMIGTGAPGLAWTPPPPAPPWTPPPLPQGERYPMHYDVAYPERMSRGTTFIRLLLLLPVVIFGTLVQYFAQFALLVGFTTVFWRKKYPDWLFRGLAGAFAWGARAYAYGLLLTDKFPSFAPEDSPVTLEYDEPPSGYLSRWRVLFWKTVLLIPQVFVLYILAFAVFAVTVIAWFGILFTGNYPRGLFQFSVGVQRWWWRVAGYFASFNDRYPPYALAENAGPASNSSTVTNGIIGGLVAAGFGTLIIVGAVVSNNHFTAEVDYALLQSGDQQPAYRFRESFGDGEVVLRLTGVADPGDELIQVLRPAANERVVVFQWTVVNGTGSNALVEGDAARFKYSYEDEDGNERTRSTTAPILTVNNVVAPANVPEFGTSAVQAVFVVPQDAEPLELRFSGGFSRGGIKYVFD